MSQKKTLNTTLDYGVCTVSVAPIRLQPKDTSEMVTQILYGETCKVIGKRAKNWLKVECAWDGYIGWMDPKQLERIDEKDFESCNTNPSYTLEIAQPVIQDHINFQVLLGSSLPNFDGMTMKFLGQRCVYNGQVFNPKQSEVTPEILIKICKKYLHAPYLWGGRSPFGIDCSGLTQQIFKMIGYDIPRDASAQVGLGEIVDFVGEIQLGDLAFFENKEGRIHHVGIIMEDKRIMHAAGEVRIDFFDHFGIYKKSRRSYTHKLRIVKRILPAGFFIKPE